MAETKKQTSLGWGVCSHERTEEILTYGGKLIGFRCAGCAKVMCHYGQCAGCKKTGKLPVYQSSKKRDFCSEACKSRTATRERKQKAVL